VSKGGRERGPSFWEGEEALLSGENEKKEKKDSDNFEK